MSTAVFPTLPGLSIEVSKSPEFSTAVRTFASGRSVSMAYWSYPRWQFKLRFDFLRAGAEAEFQQLAGFFLARQGRFDPFLFLDPDDNAVTDQPFGTGDGSTTIFQLVRSFQGFTEPIFGVLGTPVVKVAGAPTAVTVLPDGKVSFGVAPAGGAALTWSGQFYFRVRFADDVTEFERFLADLWRTRSITLEGVK